MLELGPNDHLLEIGTGWGGLALHAAQHYGCRITTTTISQQQYDLATQRIADAGLSERIEVLLVDYRDLKGQYDKIVSIEMIEAVGHHYYDAYFSQCSRLLKPDGLMLLQAITIGDWFFEAHTRTVDFIKRYIFPGSCIPSVTAMAQSLSRESDLRIVDLRDIGPHYARTLRIWRERFFEHIETVRSQGFNEEFIRMWAFYLCYCEAGFAERYIGDAQILLAKPQTAGTRNSLNLCTLKANGRIQRLSPRSGPARRDPVHACSLYPSAAHAGCNPGGYRLGHRHWICLGLPGIKRPRGSL